MPVAIITGGGAGMGLAVATALVKDDWRVALLDVNSAVGKAAAASLAGEKNQDDKESLCLFIRTDVTKYDELRAAFEAVAKRWGGNIDFVFANAGIAGKPDFYDEVEGEPQEPSLLVEEICLRGVVFTSHLAMHYMRRNTPTPGGVIVSTASAASIYASPELPLYTAAKHGVLGLMRSMSIQLAPEGIRVNSILPGAIRTMLHSKSIWDQFPVGDFTPIEEVVETVLGLVRDPTTTGRAMEISAGETFDRRQMAYCNETMQRIMQGKSY
ncbi:hypothetical protein SEUCBS140593_006985 [Sporothrix eucalyptigena]|uniref:NAD(P)-binding protein n=1 Tax=Sporothrix eucalyptigena TaxID=1812306 RepID=A0ABP0C9E6_9PEZI